MSTLDKNVHHVLVFVHGFCIENDVTGFKFIEAPSLDAAKVMGLNIMVDQFLALPLTPGHHFERHITGQHKDGDDDPSHAEIKAFGADTG